MAPSASTHGRANPSGDAGGFSSSEHHEALLQVLEGGKDLGASPLENLYCLVKKLLSIASLHDVYAGDAFCSVDLSICGPVVYGLIFHLSNWVFEELSARFGRIFPSAEAAGARFHVGQCGSSSSLQDFCALLRCCMVMLHVMEFDCNLVMEKCQVIVSMLRELCSPDVVRLFLQQRVGNDGFVPCGEAGFERFPGGSSAPVPFVCLILEVFADELLVHQSLRKHFRTYYISSASEKLPAHDCVTYDIGIILELVSAHFLLSSHEYMAFGRDFHLKFCSKMMDTVGPKLSLTAALALLGMPAIFSAPYMLQSHMILLVSKCVTSSRDISLTAMHCYLSAFEQSVIHYACHSSHLSLYHDLTGVKCQSRSFVTEHCTLEKDVGLSFDLYVQKVTYDTVNVHNQKLVEHCAKQFSIFISKTQAETVTACMTYVKENQQVIQEQWREETCLILNCIIQRIAGETGKGPLQTIEVNWQEIYYSAALLTLMGSSLLQIVAVLSEHGTKTLNDYNLCRDYDFVSGIINFFGEHSVGKYVPCDMQTPYSSKQKHTKLMLAHFTSLLFYSIDKRLYPLWEGCIFVMIAVLNLLVFEEGNLDTVRKMFDCAREMSNSRLPASKTPLGLSLRRSSIRIASDFQKVQLLHSKEMSKHLTYETSREVMLSCWNVQGHNLAVGLHALMDVGASQTDGRNGPLGTSLHISPGEVDHELSLKEIGKCNGQAFLKCLMEDHSVPDWDDLANFIEATPGKNYARWLQKRESYNKWKNKKLAVTRHQRKRTLQRKLAKRNT